MVYNTTPSTNLLAPSDWAAIAGIVGEGLAGTYGTAWAGTWAICKYQVATGKTKLKPGETCNQAIARSFEDLGKSRPDT